MKMAKKVEGLSVETLMKFVDVKYNVLLSGRHGCGKTAMIKEVFTEKYGPINQNWRYFSASTLDVFTDIIGVPTAVENPNKSSEHKTITRFAPPEGFTGDENIRAIFFDEVNRADEKTMNAIMELLQFKSVNGRRFKNLEVVWGAENPAEDAEYMVRRMDPAQKDRFHIQLNVPYELNEAYFTSKVGREYFEVARKWWKSNSDNISPRKLEEMVLGFKAGFSVTLFSNENKNTAELEKNLAAIDIVSQFVEVSQCGDAKAIVRFFTMSRLRSNLAAMTSLPEKDIVSVIGGIYEHMDDEVKKWLMSNFGKEVIMVQNMKSSNVKDVMNKMKKSGFNGKVTDKASAEAFVKATKALDVRYDIPDTKLPEDVFFDNGGKFVGIGNDTKKLTEFFEVNRDLFRNILYQASMGKKNDSLTKHVTGLLSNAAFRETMKVSASRQKEFFDQIESNEASEPKSIFAPVHAKYMLLD